MTALLEVRELSVAYGHIPVIHNLSLLVARRVRGDHADDLGPGLHKEAHRRGDQRSLVATLRPARDW